MSNVKIISNTTVYDSEDIARIVERVAPHLKEIKVRYMNKPKKRYGVYETRQASFIKRAWGSKPAELAIIRPSKIKVNALLWLAQAGDRDVLTVPDHILDDIYQELKTRNYWDPEPSGSGLGGLTLRMHNKAAGRKDAALAALREKINNKRDAIHHERGKIGEARQTIVYREKRIKDAEAALDELQKKLAKKLAKASGNKSDPRP